MHFVWLATVGDGQVCEAGRRQEDQGRIGFPRVASRVPFELTLELFALDLGSPPARRCRERHSTVPVSQDHMLTRTARTFTCTGLLTEGPVPAVFAVTDLPNV